MTTANQGRVRVDRSAVQVGKPLPFSVYDHRGHLVMRAGYVLTREAQLDRLLELGMFQDPDPAREATANRDRKNVRQARGRPIERLEDLQWQVGRVLDQLVAGDGNPETMTHRVVPELTDLSAACPDALIGYIHQEREAPYGHTHALNVAGLVLLLGRSMGFEPSTLKASAAAALTGNIGMADLQNVLLLQSDPVTAEQRREIQSHPETSAQMLEDAGVVDSAWLRVVREHHERCDGSGYPRGIGETAIHPGARLVAVADRYSASISPRQYRPQMSSQEALREMFADHNETAQCPYDREVLAALIKLLGVYPPGTRVRLASGEYAIVVKRGASKSTAPRVAAYADRNGAPYSGGPLVRDTRDPDYNVRGIAETPPPLPCPLAAFWV
ncbi:metal dependent phosphohydrolase (plasmid) [Thioalkalivibrio sp. K90mix]|uniref:HD-GYP domain-containing protein n=1 Tax=Thioalkalivibrio sp. (strain K90mix) TaxID=396595 RepID=UPI000195ABA3|nr:HD domain-containing phosphohydrolase [Thioalkalivibrio sp. K90mix]ADC73134.1 metal dependent phosphohydrolase [Thioalkalivibrio sp. K90mix]